MADVRAGHGPRAPPPRASGGTSCVRSEERVAMRRRKLMLQLSAIFPVLPLHSKKEREREKEEKKKKRINKLRGSCSNPRRPTLPALSSPTPASPNSPHSPAVVLVSSHLTLTHLPHPSCPLLPRPRLSPSSLQPADVLRRREGQHSPRLCRPHAGAHQQVLRAAAQVSHRV